MGIARVLVIGGLLFGAVAAWNDHQRAQHHHRLLASANANGFVRVLMPNGAPPDTVLIVAPLNCPHAAAQRADALSRSLTQQGIPNRRDDSVQITYDRRTPGLAELLERSAAIHDGELPIVYLDGLAQGNPSASQVIAQYQAGRASG